jgi:phage FluMu protein Com
MDGSVKMEKKCPRCKAVNVVAFINEEISIKCKLYPGGKEGFRQGFIEKGDEDFY